METKVKKVKHIVIPIEMAEEIKKLVSSRLGYISVADYVRDAVREKIQRDKWELEREREEAAKRKEESIY